MAISTFENYRQEYDRRHPKKYDNDDEIRLLDHTEGVEQFENAPLQIGPRHMIQSATDLDVGKKFLWIIRDCDLPFLREQADIAQELESRRCTHTNLTGGDEAYCGGEVWFAAKNRLIINGGSGRYPPNDDEELATVVSSFKSAGYEVCSMGWDEGIDGPARVLKGDPQWDGQGQVYR